MKGIITALVTPFHAEGSLDLAAFDRLLKDQISAGVSAVIPCGTTGESPTLSTEEKKILISEAVRTCRGTGTRVIAGTGSNSTLDTVALSSWASQAGVDGVLIVTPYYNKPSAAGLFSHFTQVADSVSCPVMLYNVPGRTGVSLPRDCSQACRPPAHSLVQRGHRQCGACLRVHRSVSGFRALTRNLLGR